jgi:hypothetical protein
VQRRSLHFQDGVSLSENFDGLAPLVGHAFAKIN